MDVGSEKIAGAAALDPHAQGTLMDEHHGNFHGQGQTAEAAEAL